MRNAKLPRVKPGDLITAEHINRLFSEAERLANIQVAYPLESHSNDGNTTIRVVSQSEAWIKITSAATGTAYAWTEQIEQSGGTWTNGPRSGTTSSDPAYEANGSTSVTLNRIVRARKRSVGGWVFEFGEC